MSEFHCDRVHPEHVVLDIGQDIGALIIYTNEELRGREIEVSLKESDTRRTHTDVLERRIHGQPVFAAVFPELAVGSYHVWWEASVPIGAITIVGGQVAELDWRLPVMDC